MLFYAVIAALAWLSAANNSKDFSMRGYSYFSGSVSDDQGGSFVVDSDCGSPILGTFRGFLTSDTKEACVNFFGNGPMSAVNLVYAASDLSPGASTKIQIMVNYSGNAVRFSDSDSADAQAKPTPFRQWTEEADVNNEFFMRNWTTATPPLFGKGMWTVCIMTQSKNNTGFYIDGKVAFPSLSACDAGHPTTAPTRAPTVTPTKTPTINPTTAPTRAPTVTVTRTPTVVGQTRNPTVRPTAVPTSAKPTAVPTASPTTARPTAAPTVYLGDYWKTRFNTEMTMIRNANTDLRSIYGEVRFGNDQMVGTCGMWGTFLTSDVAVRSATRRIKSATVYTLTNLTSALNAAPLVTSSCSDATAADSIVKSLIAPFPQSPPVNSLYPAGGSNTCGGDTWARANCVRMTSDGQKRYVPALCTGCSSANFCNISTCNDKIFNPCMSTNIACVGQSQATTSGLIRILVISYFPPMPAPTITTIAFSVTTNSSTLATITTAGDGKVMCAMLLGTAATVVPASIGEIQNARVGGKSANNVTTLRFNGLAAATGYKIYCMTESIDGLQSSLSQVTSVYPHPSVTTSCCRLVMVEPKFKSVTVNKSVTDAIRVLIPSSVATGSLTVSLKLVSSTGTEMTSKFFPASVTFSASTVNELFFTFVGHDVVGTYTVVPMLAGTAANDFDVRLKQSIEVFVKPDGAEPETPTLSSVRFADNGGSLIVSFDGATDAGGKGKSTFACSDLLNFTGDSTTKCQFTAPNVLQSFLVSSTLVPGNSVALKASTMKAMCPTGTTTCGTWAYIAASTVSIASPTNPVTPVVSLSSPDTIGSCDNLRLDTAGSYGSGGRKWSSISFTVTSADTTISSTLTDLAAWLTANYTVNNMVPPPAIPNFIFTKGKAYTFSVEVCNFLGACGSDDTSVVVLNNVLPFVKILGPDMSTRKRNDVLFLQTDAFTANCDGSLSRLNLDFSWAVLDNGVATTSVQSVSTNPSKFRVDAFSLTVGHTYTITAVVLNTLAGTSATSTTKVFIEANEIVAKLSGGDTQSLREGDPALRIDASKSVDLDCATAACNANLRYSWTCQTIAPTFSTACPLTTVPDIAASYTVLTSAGHVPETALVTVTVTDTGSSRVSSASVKVQTLAASAPTVDISVPEGQSVSNFNGDNRLKLIGRVKAAATGNVTWTVDDAGVDLGASMLTSASGSFAGSGQYSFFNFVLKKSVLAPRSTYTFTLAATQASGARAIATAVIKTNGPPVPGTFAVTPSSGDELSTSFQGAASLWTDDDLPITYAFGFLANSKTTSVSPIKGRSETQYATFTLPAGADYDSRAIRVNVMVFDSLNAATSEVATVTVNILVNATLQALIIAEQLAASAGDADASSQAVAAATASLNTVNCTAATACSATYHREDCVATTNTCGPCLSGYTGAEGDANELCVDPTAAPVGANDGTCTTDANCPGFQRCNSGMCYTPSKTCGQNCNAHGVCVFLNAVTDAVVDSCGMGSTSCDAVCDCDSGYDGDFCQYTSSELSGLKDLRTQLIQKMVMVATLQDATSDSIKSMVTSVLQLIQQYQQLNPSVGENVFTICQKILSGASAAGVPADVVSKVLAAVDTAAQLAKDASNGNSARRDRARRILASRGFEHSDASANARRRLNTAEQIAATESTHNLVADYVALAQADFIYGQAPVTNIQDSFRVVTTSSLVGTTVVNMSLPLTALETLNGVVTSDIDSMAITTNSNADSTYTFSVVSIKSQNITTDNSDLVEILSSQLSCTPTSTAPCRADVSLRNRLPVTNTLAFGGSPTQVICHKNCSAMNMETSSCACDGNPVNNLLMTCPGASYATKLTAYCPVTTSVPECRTMDVSTGAVSGDVCSTLYYNVDEIRCRCILATTADTVTDSNFVAVTVTETVAGTVTTQQFVKFTVSGVTAASFANINGAFYKGLVKTLAKAVNVPISYVTSVAVTDIASSRRLGGRMLIATGVHVSATFSSPDPTASAAALTNALVATNSFVMSFRSYAIEAGADAAEVNGLTLTSTLEYSGAQDPETVETMTDDETAAAAVLSIGAIIGIAAGGALVMGLGAYFGMSQKGDTKVTPVN